MSIPPATDPDGLPHPEDGASLPDVTTARQAEGTGQEAEFDDSSALFAELDALLERMLALPVNYLEEPQGAEGSGLTDPREEVPLITIAEAMPDPVPPCSAPLPPAVATDDGLLLQTVFALQPPEVPAAPPAPSPTLAPIAGPEKDDAANVERATLPESPALPLPPRSPLWARPLLWCNAAFDRCTALLGRPGDWLSTPAGKALLGWTGVLLLLAVCGLALCDWFGWTW